MMIFLAACATAEELPRVPAAPQVPQLVPALRGLTFHVRGVIADTGKSREEVDRAAQACMANFEKWMGAAGWIPVHDPQAPADLIIDEYCGINLSVSRHGNLFQISHPAWQDVAIIVRRGDTPIVTVPRGPADYLCESSGTPREMLRDCMARSEAWAQAHIIEALNASLGAR
jgi:hypothetical protein